MKIRTGCQYVGYFHYSEHLNWVAQNLRLGRGLDIAVLVRYVLSEKEKILNTKTMVTCKRSAAVVKKMISKTKKHTEVASGLYYPYALRGCHGKHIQSTAPGCPQVMTKNKTFPLNHSLACATCAIYLGIYACIGNVKMAQKIGKVMIKRVANEHRKQDP